MSRLYNYKGTFILDIGDRWMYFFAESRGGWWPEVAKRTGTKRKYLKKKYLIGVNYNETRR